MDLHHRMRRGEWKIGGEGETQRDLGIFLILKYVAKQTRALYTLIGHHISFSVAEREKE